MDKNLIQRHQTYIQQETLNLAVYFTRVVISVFINKYGPRAPWEQTQIYMYDF